MFGLPAGSPAIWYPIRNQYPYWRVFIIQKFFNPLMMIFVLITFFSIKEAEGVPGTPSLFFMQSGKASQAPVPKKQSSSKLYQGETLDVWLERIKKIDTSLSGSVQYIPGLLEIVNDSTVPGKNRGQAAYVLARMGPRAKHVVPEFMEIMNNEKKSLFWVLKSFEIFGKVAKPAGDSVRKVIFSPDSNLALKQAALEALIQIGPEYSQTVPTLIQLISIPITQMDPDEVELAVQAAQGVSTIGANGFAAFPFLVRQAEHPNEMFRMECVNAIAVMRTRAEPAVPLLLGLISSDSSLAVRDAARKALGQIGEPSVPGLLSLLDEESEETKKQALGSLELTKTKSPLVRNKLKLLLDDENSTIRIKAATVFWALFREPQPVIPVLIEEIQSPDRMNRTDSVNLFAQMGKSASGAVPQLELLTKDSRTSVRIAAEKAITEIQNADEN